MEKLGIRPKSSQTTQVFVTIFDKDVPELVTIAFKLATMLRETGIATEIYSGDGAKIGKQIALADRKGIPLVLVVGSDEMSKGVANLRNLKTREETQLPFEDIASAVINQLS